MCHSHRYCSEPRTFKKPRPVVIDDWFKPTGGLWAPVTTRIGDCTLTGHPGGKRETNETCLCKREPPPEWKEFSKTLPTAFINFPFPPKILLRKRNEKKNKWEGKLLKPPRSLRQCVFFKIFRKIEDEINKFSKQGWVWNYHLMGSRGVGWIELSPLLGRSNGVLAGFNIVK